MKALKIVGILFLFLIVIGSGVVFYMWKKIERESVNEFEQTKIQMKAEFSKFIPQYLDDQTWVRGRLPFLEVTTHDRDAGEFLNSQFQWAANSNSPKGKLEIDEELSKLLVSPINYGDFKSFDKLPSSAWMDELSRFDHWDFMAQDTNKKALESLDYVPWLKAIPNQRNWSDWAKIRLLRGIKDKKVNEAVDVIRHFAKIILSSESLVSSMVASSILNVEVQFAEWLLANPEKIIFPQPKDRLLSFEEHFRLKRILWSAPAFVQPFSGLGLEVILKAKEPLLGICAGLDEAAESANYFRFLTEGILAPELNELDRIVAELHTLPATKNCRLLGLKKIWNNKAYLEKIYSSDSMKDFFMLDKNIFSMDSQNSEVRGVETSAASRFPKRQILQKYSTIRDISARILSAVAIPNFWKLYHTTALEVRTGKKNEAI